MNTWRTLAKQTSRRSRVPAGTDSRMSAASEQAPLCSLCGAPGEFYLSERDRYLGLRPEMSHPYFRCSACDHLYQPQVDPALLLPFYPPAYYGAPRTSVLRSQIGKLRQGGRARAVEWRAAKGRAIDIGCGRGLVLQQLQKRGWQVSGMDWNADNAREVAERLGIPVAAGPQALMSLDASCYDAASLFHVLEHEQRPLELLAQVHRLLKPGGRLVVAVPNGASTARALFGRHWAGYDFARHRQVFTPHSLGVALQRTDFSIERIEGRLSDELIDIYRSAELLVPRSSRLRPLIVAAATISATAIAALPRLLGAHSVMYVYALKP